MTTTKQQNQAAAVAVSSAFIEALCEATGDWTIGAQQITLLIQLHIHGSIAQGDLTKYTRMEKSANSRNIAKLGMGSWVTPAGKAPTFKDGPGYVEAVEDFENRRTNIVRLTQKGRLLMDSVAAKAALYFPK